MRPIAHKGSPRTLPTRGAKALGFEPGQVIGREAYDLL
jgi:hypothetical protein